MLNEIPESLPVKLGENGWLAIEINKSSAINVE